MSTHPTPGRPAPALVTAQSVLSTPPAQVSKPLVPFRIQFSTPVVKPDALPGFPYVVTRVNFDAIVFTARIMASDLDAAIAYLRVYWPRAEPQEAEEGVNEFHDADMRLTSRQFGAVEVKPRRRGISSRIWALIKALG